MCRCRGLGARGICARRQQKILLTQKLSPNQGWTWCSPLPRAQAMAPRTHAAATLAGLLWTPGPAWTHDSTCSQALSAGADVRQGVQSGPGTPAGQGAEALAFVLAAPRAALGPIAPTPLHAGCGQPGMPGVYARLDAFAAFISQQGYCGCSSTGLSGGVDTRTPGCAPATWQAEQQAGLQLAASSGACYVIDPQRCPYALPSRLLAGAGVAPCDPATNLTAPGSAAAPAAESGAPPAVIPAPQLEQLKRRWCPCVP